MSLNAFYTFLGNGNWSIDGAGGTATDGGDMTVIVPEGSEIEVAFLHATAFNSGRDPAVTLSSGTAAQVIETASFTSLGINPNSPGLEAHRADVTAFVESVIGDGDVDPFTFAVSGMGGSIDGYTLEVVYSNPNEVERTIVFFDGFSDSDGDAFSLNLSEPLVVNQNLEALMSLGIGFGFQGTRENSPVSQFSEVDINGQRLTSAAGSYDDGSAGNGGLVTIGGVGDDPANPADPNAGPNGLPDFDDELYNLALDGFLETGDRTILVNTLNPSSDDNIFFAGFNLTARAQVVSEGNDAPVAINDGGNQAPGFTTNRDTAIITPSVLINDFDPDFDVISVTGVQGTVPVNVGDTFTLASGAQITLLANGTFNYNPNDAFDALPDGQDVTDTFTYTISDGALTDTATVTIDVTDEDPAPAYVRLVGNGVLEGDNGTTNLNFDVVRSGNLSVAIDFEVTVTAGTANNADVVGTFPFVLTGTVAAGATTATVSVPVNGDVVPEFDETVIGEITSMSASVPNVAVEFLVPAHAVATGTIVDDDVILPPPPPTVEADIFGDPHLTTLDGLGYDFQAVGEFVLLEATSGDPLNVQVRTEALNDAVSVITVVAVEIDGHRVQIDLNSDNPLTIDGVATTIDPLVGPVDVGAGQVFFNSQANMYTMLMPSGEQVVVGVYSNFLNSCVFLNDTRPAGTVQGLLGNADANTTNDLALRDGTVLAQPVDFSTLYSTYADSWRIAESEALFDRANGETTADFTDTTHPKVALTLDDLPQQVVASARAVVEAAGITDPILKAAAILDVALTGNTEFATAANNLAASPTVDTAPANAPALPPTIGISASSFTLTEGNAGEKVALFEVYRIGDTSGALDVDVTFGGTVDANDVSTSLAPTTVSFADGESSKSVAVTITGDNTVEADETLTATISIDEVANPNVLVVATSASTTIANDDGDDAPVNTPPTGVVVVGGTPIEGQTLTAVTGGLQDADGLGSFSFQWMRNGAPIAGATAATYVAQVHDIDQFIQVAVSYTDGGGTDESVVSNAAQIDMRPATNGNDVIFGSPLLDDTIVGLDGADAIFGLAGNDRLDGGPGNDSVQGGDGNDGVIGGDGNDTLSGGNGDDNVASGAGNDIAAGDAGNDLMGGGQGNDTMSGGTGNDFMGGGLDDDVMDGGPGNDVVNGGPGDDTIAGGDGNDTMGGSFGNDFVFGGGGDDDLGGGAGRDYIDAGDGNDSVGGGEGNDTIFGGTGDDFLAGGGRDDVIDGGAGRDKINGGAGNDQMTGGAGADLFIFNEFFAGENDVITDFQDGLDMFRVSVSPFGGVDAFLNAMTITDTAQGAYIGIAGGGVLVQGVTAAQLDQNDVIFI